MKYKLAAFFSSHTLQTLPPAPWAGQPSSATIDDRPDAILASGGFVWVQNFLHTADEIKRMEFLASILQSKKGMPRFSDAETQKAAQDTFVLLTTEPKAATRQPLLVGWYEAESFPENIELSLSVWSWQEQIERTVKELFFGKMMTWEDRVRPFFPSTSANYINTRSKGGAVGTLLEDPDILTGCRVPGGWLEVEVGKDDEKDEQIQSDESIETWKVNVVPLEAAYETIWLKMLNRAIKEEPTVKLVALKEAIKTRVISKGPPYQQMVLKSIWKWVHTVLRKHPTFQLIGEPESTRIIQTALGRNLADDEVFLSGDYRSATDLLYVWVCNAVAKALANTINLSELEAQLVTRALTGHLIENPDDPTDVRPQRRGQLMGSIISFVVLCIINATGGRWSIEVAERQRRTLAQCRMLINGDDIVMKSKASVYKYWNRIMAFAGLEESVGKTFISRMFLNINSQNLLHGIPSQVKWTYPDGTERLVLELYHMVKYVNFGLIQGLKRSGGAHGLDDQDDPQSNLACRARQLIHKSPDWCRDQVMEMFITHNKYMMLARLPWFIPEWLGGYGLPLFGRHVISTVDLRIASAILLNWKQRRPRPLRAAQPWWLRQLATAELPTPAQAKVKGVASENWERIVGWKTLDLLLDSNIALQDMLHEDVARSAVKAAIRHNERLWQDYLHKGNLPPPLDVSRLEFQPTYDGVARLSLKQDSGTRTRHGDSEIVQKSAARDLIIQDPLIELD